MTDKSSTPKVGKKGGLHSQTIVAGTIGAVVGGAMGAAAGIALSDKNTRRKVGEAVSGAREYAEDVMSEVAAEEEEFSYKPPTTTKQPVTMKK